MTAVRADIESLIPKELESANRPFHSTHEGYAVLLEEVEECEEAMREVRRLLDELWVYVRGNYAHEMYAIRGKIKEAALDLACEAVQVAAMAMTFEVF